MRQRASWRDRLARAGRRLSALAVVLAVTGAVVAASFGYPLVGGLVGAAVVVGLGTATLVHHRRAAALGDGGWWR